MIITKPLIPILGQGGDPHTCQGKKNSPIRTLSAPTKKKRPSRKSSVIDIIGAGGEG